MGSFDKVYFNCPSCGGTNERQTKAGPCEYHEWHIAEAPLECIADLGKVDCCDECGDPIKFIVQYMVLVIEDRDWK